MAMDPLLFHSTDDSNPIQRLKDRASRKKMIHQLRSQIKM